MLSKTELAVRAVQLNSFSLFKKIHDKNIDTLYLCNACQSLGRKYVKILFAFSAQMDKEFKEEIITDYQIEIFGTFYRNLYFHTSTTTYPNIRNMLSLLEHGSKSDRVGYILQYFASDDHKNGPYKFTEFEIRLLKEYEDYWKCLSYFRDGLSIRRDAHKMTLNVTVLNKIKLEENLTQIQVYKNCYFFVKTFLKEASRKGQKCKLLTTE
jgi:hypothetical protein